MHENRIFLAKSFGGSKNSRTFAPAFQERGAKKKEFFERFTQTEVVQEASTYIAIGTWVERNKPLIQN